MLSYSQLLERAQGETARLKATVDELSNELDEMGINFLKLGWHKGFESYYLERREVHTRLVYAERDLERSRRREAECRRRIAAGEVRGQLVAA